MSAAKRSPVPVNLAGSLGISTRADSPGEGKDIVKLVRYLSNTPLLFLARRISLFGLAGSSMLESMTVLLPMDKRPSMACTEREREGERERTDTA